MKKILIKFYLIICLGTFSIFAENHLKIGYWSTWKIPCGIAMFTEHLANSLKKYGHDVFVYNNNIDQRELLESLIKDKIEVLNIQYEESLFPKRQNFIDILKEIRKLGIKIIIIPHCEDTFIDEISNLVDKYIYLKPPVYLKKLDKFVLIPHPVPVFEYLKNSRDLLRNKYGFVSDDKILITTGFLLHTKEIAEILDLLVPFLKSDPKIKVQLITPFTTRFPEHCMREYKKIVDVIKKSSIEKRITLITDFVSHEELAERISLSDLGYQWFKVNTYSTSGAAREYISSRTPLVICASSHYHDLRKGVVKTDFNKDVFVKSIITVLNDKKLLDQLKIEQEESYNEFNYDKLILNHIKVFKDCLKQ